MATKPVRVDFMVDGEPLKFMHDIPSSLVTNSASHPDSQYMNLFISTIQSIIQEHYDAAYNACRSTCNICGSPKTRMTASPMSWLHYPAEPSINVMCAPICNKGGCDTKTRQNIQILMQSLERDAPAATEEDKDENEGKKKIQEILPCRVCGKLEKTFKCARCRTAFYCGKEHQVEDWPAHKKACKEIVKGREWQ